MDSNKLKKKEDNIPILDPNNMARNQESLKFEGGNTSNSGHFETIQDLLVCLNQLSPKTKVRVIFKDYGSYKEFLPYYEIYKQKFSLFKDRKDFILSISDNRDNNAKNETMKESLLKFLDANKINEDIKKILTEEIK
jgi:hypothetical protein